MSNRIHLSNNPPPPPQPAPASPRPPSGPSKQNGRRQDWPGGADRTPRWIRGAARADRQIRRLTGPDYPGQPVPTGPNEPNPKAA